MSPPRTSPAAVPTPKRLLGHGTNELVTPIRGEPTPASVACQHPGDIAPRGRRPSNVDDLHALEVTPGVAGLAVAVLVRDGSQIVYFAGTRLKIPMYLLRIRGRPDHKKLKSRPRLSSLLFGSRQPLLCLNSRLSLSRSHFETALPCNLSPASSALAGDQVWH